MRKQNYHPRQPTSKRFRRINCRIPTAEVPLVVKRPELYVRRENVRVTYTIFYLRRGHSSHCARCPTRYAVSSRHGEVRSATLCADCCSDTVRSFKLQDCIRIG